KSKVGQFTSMSCARASEYREVRILDRLQQREDVMKFMLTFAIRPETKARDEAIERFKATGGQPPKGAKLLGRWTAADFSGGFDLLESEDPKALTEFALMWSDLMELKIAPVVDDGELGDVLRRRK